MGGMPSPAETFSGVPSGIPADPARNDAALQHGIWRRFASLSSRLARRAVRPGNFPRPGQRPTAALLRVRLAGVIDRIERSLDTAGFDRAPWLAVGFGTGIGLWFALDNRGGWLGLIALSLGLTLGAAALLRAHGRYPYLRLAVMALGLMVAAGCGTVWTKSAIMGTPPIARAMVPCG